jgi:hypothetical protein
MEAKHDDPGVIPRRVIEDAGEIQVLGQDRATLTLADGCHIFIRTSLHLLIVHADGVVPILPEEFGDLFVQILVDLVPHLRSPRGA